MSCRNCLRGTLWLSNLLLLLLGLGMLGYFGYMVSELATGKCSDDFAAPAPTPAPASGPMDELMYSEETTTTTTTTTMTATAAAAAPSLSPSTGRHLLSDSFHQKDLLEFVLPFGVCGVAVVLTTILGMLGIACSSRCLLNTYLCLLLLMTLVQIVMVVLIVDKKSPSFPQNDQYERCEYHRLKHYYDKYHPEAIGLAIVGVVLEIISFVAVCCLRSMKRVSADIDPEEGEHHYRKLDSQPAPSPSPSRMSRESRAGREGWHQRMREKYGLDTTVFEADPVPVATAQPEPKNKCLIM